MTVIDPRFLAEQKSDTYRLKMRDIRPENLKPNGDRYVVEEIQMDDNFVFGEILVVTNINADPNANTPQADPTIEKRGVFAAVVLRAGNGHLLGLPDLAPVEHDIKSADGEVVWNAGDRPWPSVDMFYEPGDVIFVDLNAKGRAWKLPGRGIIRTCNQIDVLNSLEDDSGKPVRLVRKDGTWAEVE